MKRGLALVALLWAGLALAGCGGGSQPSADGQKKEQGDKSAASQPAGPDELVITPDSTPDEVVTAFIEAMRGGNPEGTAELLTTKAREETAKHGMQVAPTAMPGAQYQVAQPKYIKNNPNGAHVSCLLKETFEDGQTAEYEIVWVLRREAEIGWRVAGMAVELVPGQPPQFLNFEDPQDMQKKKADAMAAMQPPEEDPAAREARNPEGTGAPDTKGTGSENPLRLE